VQVRAGVSNNWDSHHMGGVQEDKKEEALLQSALARLNAAKDAAQKKLKEEARPKDKGDSKAGAGSAAGKGSPGTTRAKDEEKQGVQQSANNTDEQQEGYSKQVMQDPTVQAALAAVEQVKAERKSRQFPLVVSAYLATAAVSGLKEARLACVGA
jgi:hypothetical protein